MRISRRTSGGRGEYEISGQVTGLGPQDIRDRVITIDLGPIGLVPTAIELREQGGKLRLRRLDGTGIQIARQLAAALLLPPPVRADEALGAGHPVVQRNRYALETVEIASARILSAQEVTLTPQAVIARNRSDSAEEIDVNGRTANVASLWQRADEFPAEIADLLRRHQRRCLSGVPLSTADEHLIDELQTAVAERSGDLGIIYSDTADVVPALTAALLLQRPEPLLRIEDIDPEDVPLKRRAIKEWKRWANARGPASAKFRQQVRAAYRSTCLLCGVTFPGTTVTLAGVDAAHILPWSEYDLDSVTNGLCLCKQHHWAFDETIVRLSFLGGVYVSSVDRRLAALVAADPPELSLGEHQRYEGAISDEMLPTNPLHRPSPEFLQILADSEYHPVH
jgi:putative restriction endonuclease